MLPPLLLVAVWLALPGSARPTHPRHLPKGGIIAGYPDWEYCGDKVLEAVENGLNVIIWFSTNLEKDSRGRPAITGAIPDLDCVARVASEARKKGYEVAHMVSIGGWNAPHPDPSFTAAEWYHSWRHWNEHVVARDGLEGGFDGFDWDLEGNDSPEAVNHFSMATLDIMGGMSVLAKKDGYLVAMAPAQSYLDCSTSDFSRSLVLPPHDKGWHQDFHYHGRNSYGYLLAKYALETFDFVSVQLYEGWSHANYVVSTGTDPAEYIVDLSLTVQKGWSVRFEDDPQVRLPRTTLHIPAERLVIGLANGWAAPPPDSKFMLLWPRDLHRAWERLAAPTRPRGFMFWNIRHEGDTVPGTQHPLFLTKDLAAFVRPDFRAANCSPAN